MSAAITVAAFEASLALVIFLVVVAIIAMVLNRLSKSGNIE